MFPSGGERLLIHLRRGKIIDSECMIVGGGMVLKLLLTPLLLLHRLSFIPLNLAAIICFRIATRQSFLCYSRRVKSQSFELEGCVLVRNDLFMAQCAQHWKIIYPWGPASHQGHSKEILTCDIACYVLPEAFVHSNKRENKCLQRNSQLYEAGPWHPLD